MNRTLLVAGLAVVAASSQAAILTQWNFNTSLTVPSIGTGSQFLVGGTTQTSVSGTGSTDAGSPNNALNTSGYPAQGTGNKTAGVGFFTSTVGQGDIIVTWDNRHSGTASRYTRFQYTTNSGASWIDGPLFDTNVTTFVNNRSVDLSAVSAVENNAQFGFRFVSEFAPGGSTYAPTTSTSSYGTGGTMRYDMVTVNASPVPEPASMIALGAGLLALARRRRSK